MLRSQQTETSPRRPTPAQEIGACTRSQLKEVMVLVETALAAQHPRIKDWIAEHRDEFCGPARPIWWVRQDGNLVGVLIARMDNSKDAKCSLVISTDKEREYQIRTALLSAFEQAALRLGKSTIHLNVYADDLENLNFFKNHGYRKVEEIHHETEYPERPRYVLAKRPLLRS